MIVVVGRSSSLHTSPLTLRQVCELLLVKAKGYFSELPQGFI